jgi:hypothetical protein
MKVFLFVFNAGLEACVELKGSPLAVYCNSADCSGKIYGLDRVLIFLKILQ